MPKATRWKRRADARPQEIAHAALLAFATRGYAAARLVDIAKQAGVSKAALYLYYPTKSDLFRAVLLDRMQPMVIQLVAKADRPVVRVVDDFLHKLAAAISKPEVRKIARMVIAESGNFPEIAAAWYEAVVDPAVHALSRFIRQAQTNGEVRQGDARLLALTVIGPMIAALIWCEVIEPVGGKKVNFQRLACEHAASLKVGLFTGN